MNVNKRIGCWISNSTLLDNVAYSLYVNNVAKYNKGIINDSEINECYLAQYMIIEKRFHIESIKNLYTEAENIILKNERFKKLNKIIQFNN